jgi:hypothetical protein
MGLKLSFSTSGFSIKFCVQIPHVCGSLSLPLCLSLSLFYLILVLLLKYIFLSFFISSFISRSFILQEDLHLAKLEKLSDPALPPSAPVALALAVCPLH